MVDEIKRALEIAETIPFKYLVQHIGVGGEDIRLSNKFDAAFSAIEAAEPFRAAARRGNAAGEHSQRTFLGERLQQFQELTHLA
jgi:hypothetical protein